MNESIDWEERVESLRSEVQTYGQDVVNLVNSVYGGENVNNNASYDFKNSPFQMVAMLRKEVAELVAEMHSKEEFLANNQADITFCNDITAVLINVSCIVDLLNKFEDRFGRLAFDECVDILENAQMKLNSLPPGDSFFGDGEVCKILRREYKLQKSRLAHTVRNLLREAITIESGTIIVKKVLSGYLRSENRVITEPIQLQNLWQIALDCEIAEDHAVELVNSLWREILVVVWKEKKFLLPKVTSNDEIAELIIISNVRGAAAATNASEKSSSLTINKVKYLGVNKMPVHDLFELLSQIFAFTFQEAFCALDEAASVFGKRLFDEPYSFVKVLTTSVANHLPKTEGELTSYRRGLEEPARSLQTKLTTYFGLGSGNGSEEEGGGLTQAIENINATFSYIRRRDILKYARDLVIADYHNTMVASGDALEDELASAGTIGDPQAMLDTSGSIAIQKLKFDTCQVSLAACRLLKFVHEVMSQATMALSVEVATVLFHTARDCLELFLAVVPAKFAETIETSPRMGAVFFNDCMYLSHNTVLLTHRYRQEIKDETLQASIAFIDFIPRLRNAAEKCLVGNHLSSQQTVLLEMVRRIKLRPDRDPSQSSAVTTHDRKNLLSESLKMAGKLKNQFLQRGTAEGASKFQAESSERIMTSIDELEDESPENNEAGAGALLGHLERLSAQWLGVLQEEVYGKVMGQLLDAVFREAMSPLLEADLISAVAASEIYRIFKTLQRARSLLPSLLNIKVMCASYVKFCALTDMLEFKLNDIADGVNKRKFVDFKPLEMIKLVRSLFEDTPRRHTLIQGLEAAATGGASTASAAATK